MTGARYGHHFNTGKTRCARHFRADKMKCFAITKRLVLGRGYMPRAVDPIPGCIAGRLVIFQVYSGFPS